MLPSARTVHSVCSLDCPDTCGVLVTVETAADGSERATRVQGDPAHPVTRGFLCGKVAKFLDRVYAPDRLLYPMRRRPGVPKGPLVRGREQEAFERISWDTALSEIASRLKHIAAEHGPESILPYSYAGTIGQLGYGSMDRRFFSRLGACQLDRTICSAAGGAALTAVYGIRLGTAPQDFAEAGLILAWGANIHGNNIHLWPFIEQARRRGAKLVVLDPYRTRTAALADQHLAIHPGTDALLALSLMHVIFREGLEDREYIAACTHGADELRAHALKEAHAPERAAAVTGIAAETIVQLARDYATAFKRTGSPAVIRLNYGIQRSENGGTAARAVCMLPLLTGAWKHPGGGLQLSTSGAFPFDKPALERPDLANASPLGRPGRTVNMSQLGQALDPSAAAPAKAVFVYNSNPAAVAPNQNAVLQGFRRDDLFTVVHDQFFTDTTDYADYVLPAPTFLEVKDVHGAYGHTFVQLNAQAIQPLGEARPNVALFGALARHMGFEEACFDDREEDLIDQALGSDRDGQHPWFAGVTRERLEQEGHVALTLPTIEGRTLPFSDASWFRTPSGRGELVPVPVFTAPAESRANATGAYPLEFLGRKAYHWMNSTFANHEAHRALENVAGLLEIHAEDASARGLATGDEVEIFNARGSLTLRAHVSDRIVKGAVAATLDWSKLGGDLSGRGRNVNALTSETVADLAGGATFYSCLVEVRKPSP